MQQTKPERIGALQLIPGVLRTRRHGAQRGGRPMVTVIRAVAAVALILGGACSQERVMGMALPPENETPAMRQRACAPKVTPRFVVLTVDPAQDPIPNAEVFLLSDDDAIIKATTSGACGRVVLRPPTGVEYGVAAYHEGYTPALARHVGHEDGCKTTLTLVLRPSR